MFGCYDQDLNAVFVGTLSDGEIDLYAINRVESEKILLDIDDYDRPEEES